jgi:hypothetical protein
MKPIKVRYGASLELQVTNDDTDAASASLYVGLAGETPIITKTGSFISGTADLSLDPEETEVPLGEYKYQINVLYDDGRLEKYPVASCDDDFPIFEVLEALDETEVES